MLTHELPGITDKPVLVAVKLDKHDVPPEIAATIPGAIAAQPPGTAMLRLDGFN